VKYSKINKLFKCLSEHGWIFMTIFLALAIWFETDHIVKSNHDAIKRIDRQINALDEDVDNNAIEIKGLQGHFKCIENK